MKPSYFIFGITFMALALVLSLGIKTETTSAIVDLPPLKAWELFSDTKNLEEWNPAFSRVTGSLTRGESIEIHLAKGMKSTSLFTPEVLSIIPGERIEWEGRYLFPYVLNRRHVITFTPAGKGSTMIQVEEHRMGIMVPFSNDDSIIKGFTVMMGTIKKRTK
jgi:hypothetical protein